MATSPEHIDLEIPRLGEFARQHARISSEVIRDCLALQRKTGNRLGAILVQQGYLTGHELLELLRLQAQWAARMRSRDLKGEQFPLSTPLSLCLPCYNEQDVIGEVLKGILAVLPEFLDEFEIVCVDDGSKDATAAIIGKMAERDDRIRLVKHEKNRGYGAAVSTAMRAARGEWIVFTDGDGQFNMLDMPQLLANAHKADLVVGYRHNRADNGMRKLNAASWKYLIRALMGLQGVRDLDCAFKLFPRWIVDKLQMNSEGACINAEVLTQCMRGGVSILEVPVNHFPRSAGKATGANLKVVLKAFRELPVVWQYRKMAPWTIERRKVNGSAAAMKAARREASGREVSPALMADSHGADLPAPLVGER